VRRNRRRDLDNTRHPVEAGVKPIAVGNNPGCALDLSPFFLPIFLTALRLHSYAADLVNSIGGMFPNEL
jgi:hypothetical protein